MSTKAKGIFIALLSAVLAAVMSFGAFADVTLDDIAAKKNEISDLQNKLYAQNQIKQETASKLDGIANEITATEETKNELLTQIENISEEIETTQLLIENYGNYIELKEQEISDTEAYLAGLEEQFTEYLRYEYEQGSSTLRYAEVLLSSASLSEFLTNIHYIGSIFDYQEHLMSEYEATITKLNTQKTELSEAKADKETYIVQLNDSQAECESLVVKAQEYMVQLELSQDELNAYYNQTEDEADSLSSQILAAQKEKDELQSDYNKQEEYKAYLAEQARLAETARKKAEAEAAAAAAAAAAAQEEARKQVTGDIVGSVSFMWPVKANVRYIISTWYGWEPNPIGTGNRFHKAIDIALAAGNDIYAAADGKVVISKYSSSYGYYVVILHDNGYSTLYAHASKLLVSVGDRVVQGQIIAKVGSTGYSTGAHVHFEIILKDGETRVDPMFFFKTIYKAHVNDSGHNDSMNKNTNRYRPEKNQTTM